MSLGRRIGKIISGLLIIAGAVIIILVPEIGYLVITLVFGISLLAKAISSLSYYFSMARHMVGGRSTLYSGLIQLDLAIFTLSLSSVPKTFIMVYLVSVYGVTGVLRLARAMEAKKKGQPSWKRSLISGLFHLGISVICTFFIGNMVVVGIIYGIGLIYTGATRIISAFYRARIVYIQ